MGQNLFDIQYIFGREKSSWHICSPTPNLLGLLFHHIPSPGSIYIGAMHCYLAKLPFLTAPRLFSAPRPASAERSSARWGAWSWPTSSRSRTRSAPPDQSQNSGKTAWGSTIAHFDKLKRWWRKERKNFYRLNIFLCLVNPYIFKMISSKYINQNTKDFIKVIHFWQVIKYRILKCNGSN